MFQRPLDHYQALAGEARRSWPVRAPRAGYVLHKDIVRGARVQAGRDLYRIGDLRRIWVTADVYEFDAPWVAVGQPAQMEISFEEAAFGREIEIRVPRRETCDRCAGTGSKDGNLTTCATCGGQGRVRFSQGFFSVAQTCPQCRGEGQMVADPCPDCRGDGRQERQRNLKVTIPAGVDNGIRMRLRGEGEHGRRGGPPEHPTDASVTPSCSASQCSSASVSCTTDATSTSSGSSGGVMPRRRRRSVTSTSSSTPSCRTPTRRRCSCATKTCTSCVTTP